MLEVLSGERRTKHDTPSPHPRDSPMIPFLIMPPLFSTATKLGFAGTTWGNFTSCTAWTTLANMATTNLSSINDCKVIITGKIALGSYANFGSGDWATVLTWIQNGGRLIVFGEFNSASFDLFTPTDRDDANDFLSALGSSIQFDTGTNPVNGLTGCIIGAATAVPLMSGFSGINYDDSGVVSGGTTVANRNASDGDTQPLAAVEQLGDGFVMALACVSTFYSCYSDNCDWFERWFNGTNSEIL
jgi:hypothetical protein